MSDIESVALTGSLKPQNFTRPREQMREKKRERERRESGRDAELFTEARITEEVGWSETEE